eukprot:TRINITY_DN92756_c0_g1_i1.p1 TRINITY_DN92756_c0_g1~~TRINITY_DN92756_c0_g1_i1.p1  ORF type:complete len:409 (+),score=64.25 TRINITY_DN92756_c0_g1_i1:60-1286(+)
MVWPVKWFTTTRAAASAGRGRVVVRAALLSQRFTSTRRRCRPEPCSRTLASDVQVSRQFFEQLVESEIVHFARALTPQAITLQEILAHKDPEPLRHFLLEELPIRYARRVHLLQSLPHWQNYEEISVLREYYGNAFKRLRSVPEDDRDAFRRTVLDIKRNSGNVLENVVKGARYMKDKSEMTDADATKFLDEFLTARIGTDLLASQYLSLSSERAPRSVIDPDCDVVSVIRRAVEDAEEVCEQHYDVSPPVEVQHRGSVVFPFIPQYLNFIMFEITKNALRAVVERFGEAAENHPVRITACADDETVVIRISDEGGGIPMDGLSKVWSYLYTTAKVNAADANDWEDDRGPAPMAGFGVGLPLSRNYAAYVGGRLELNTMPHHGTDAYVYFNRLSDSAECGFQCGLMTA